MVMNKVKGNMYSFCTHTWNAIKGKCPHDCSYCYMKRFPQKELRFDEKELKTDLGEGNFIFVGSSTDMWADNVPNEWIDRTLNHCIKYPKNTYLFQSKNPKRFIKFRDKFLELQCILGTTIETNRKTPSNAPRVQERAVYMRDENLFGMKKMITIEPIMDFDLDILVKWMKEIKPEFVNIGADSNSNPTLPEPSWKKIQLLIKELEKFTKVNLKDNLVRIRNKK